MSTIHDAQADRLDALIAIPGHAFVEHADEFVHGDTREVSFMKEILLESAEEDQWRTIPRPLPPCGQDSKTARTVASR